TSFLLLITMSNEGTKTIPDDQKPVVLLCIGCSLIASSVFLFLKSIWKACYKTSKLPRKATIALVLFFEFLVSVGAAILTIVAMPHLDIVTNVTILNGVAVLSTLLQVIAQCTAKERNRFLLPSITAFILILLGYALFLALYIMKDPTDIKMAIWVGLAVGGSFLVSFNWWENYFRLIGDNSSSVFLKSLCKDMTKCQNILHILSSLLRIVVTTCVLGAYVPLAKMDWEIVKSIPSRETRIIAITIGVQLISSALCHWFAVAACKMHALRRCFILPLYLASLAVMALLVIPVIVYYQDYRISSAVSWWLGLVLATLHLWYLNVYRIQRTQDLFVRRLYEGAFIEQSLLLNTRFDIQAKSRKKNLKALETAMVYLCATMWHETYDEMMNIIISIFSIFTNIDKKLFKQQQQFPDQKVIRTPYGGRVVITMPHGNNIVVHFKDKELIRHKKRWSQVMYLYYLLGWKLMTKYYGRWKMGGEEKELGAEVQKEKHNTYLLALDGDTDFQPAAVMLLIDRLKMYPRVGAACGRIHPTGSGPAVWFQKFEYAVSHWLQKTAEHVFGCVLCSPGCFSLFRAAALMDDNVMKKYSTKSMEASHYIQYDQGEDRWLCTLLLKQGWRVEYNAASDAYTNAPEDFKELYNQRRRWGPSTMANVVDLLGSSNIISQKNSSMSKPFMFYQLFSIISAILAPATICLLVAGSLAFILNIHSAAALVMSVIPPAIYLGLCFKLKADTQITIAAVLSVMYAFLMLVVTMSIIGSMVKDKTILTPSSIFVIAMATIYIITAIMHPQEFPIVFYGVLYIICIPSAYLLLTIYSMVNMNNVSWGTRETKPAAGAATPAANTPQTTKQKGRFYFCATQCNTRPVLLFVLTELGMIFTLAAKRTFQRLFSWVKCCKKSNRRSEESQLSVNQENMIPEPAQPEPQPQNTIVEDIGIPEEEQRQAPPVFDCPSQCWVTQLQESSNDMRLQEDSLDQEEQEFWMELQEKYLKPLSDDKERQKKIASDLRELRNKINFAFFILNALWLVATFTLQVFNAVLSITIPKFNHSLVQTGDKIQIDPIALMFIAGFALSVIIQFLAMLYHRVYTLIHYVAFLDTEPREQKHEKQDSYQQGKKVDSVSSTASISSASTQEDSEFDSEDEYYSDLYYRQNDGGTLV
ncbi:chitin synthase chs-1-like protein, partial [Lates japonicus]